MQERTAARAFPTARAARDAWTVGASATRRRARPVAAALAGACSPPNRHAEAMVPRASPAIQSGRPAAPPERAAAAISLNAPTVRSASPASARGSGSTPGRCLRPAACRPWCSCHQGRWQLSEATSPIRPHHFWKSTTCKRVSSPLVQRRLWSECSMAPLRSEMDECSYWEALRRSAGRIRTRVTANSLTPLPGPGQTQE